MWKWLLVVVGSLLIGFVLVIRKHNFVEVSYEMKNLGNCTTKIEKFQKTYNYLNHTLSS